MMSYLNQIKYYPLKLFVKIKIILGKSMHNFLR
jgi:hypothetical protein